MKIMGLQALVCARRRAAVEKEGRNWVAAGLGAHLEARGYLLLG
jgi:hypothetical protein